MCACVRHGCVGEWVGRVGIVGVCVCRVLTTKVLRVPVGAKLFKAFEAHGTGVLR